RPESEALSWRLVAALARRKRWLAGIGCAFAAYGFQSVALLWAPLSLVQPIIVSELVFAVPLSFRVHRLRPGPREWAGIGAVACGLAVALVAAGPQGGAATADAKGWVLALGAACVLVSAAVLLSRTVCGTARSSMLALAGGVVMGVQSVLLAATIREWRDGAGAVFTSWQTYLLIVASLLGLLLIQSALSTGPLASSLTVVDVTEPIVAVTIGIALFGESITGGPMRLVWAATGAVTALVGIVLLDTSPAVRTLHAGQQRAKPRDRGPVDTGHASS
ncbi:DMT family transporter, partial [Yinghuangia sp. YIM S10712]|uniref:DMT family transporter n=1 Tax=Yinghuangia sp. YIM S10712 TaxID=3436930 RepID=UPI003F534D4E